MRAVIRRNKQLVCDEIADLKPQAGQVLVRTLACGICGSDLHALHHMEHMIDLTRRAGGIGEGRAAGESAIRGRACNAARSSQRCPRARICAKACGPC